MSDTNKQVELIRTSFLKNPASAHPLKEHPIDNCEEYVQKLYIDALTVTAQYENKNAEAANKFIQRIMAGAGLKEPFTEHLKNAFEITPERYGEFLKQCAENKLTDIFLIDSMIIACAAGEPNKKQVDFVAETADMLSVRKNRFEWLTGIAKCILMQSSEEYKAVCEKIPHDEKNEILPQIVCYLKEFISGVLLDTDDIYWVFSKDKIVFMNESELYIHDRKKVIFENIINNRTISMQSCKSVFFKNCELNHLDLSSISKADYFDCIFTGNDTNDSVNCFEYKNCDGISVRYISCTISNYRGGDRWNDGSFKLTNGCHKIQVLVDNCHFSNLSRNSTYGKNLICGCQGFDDDVKGTVKNSEFINCPYPHSYWNSQYIKSENNIIIS